ncbi:MAG TPA: hypothetical protein VF009_05075 [Solirubrobacterales bacterium]
MTEPSKRAHLGSVLAAATIAMAAILLLASPAEASVLGPGGFTVATSSEQAGAHADITTDVEFETAEGVTTEAVKDVVVDLPAGFTGAPAGVPQCPTQLFIKTVNLFLGEPGCPDSTQVGYAQVMLGVLGGSFPVEVPVYNLVPDAGQPSKFGFTAILVGIQFSATVRPDDYGLRTTFHNISEIASLDSTKLTLWGVPADPSHNALRGRVCIYSSEFCPYPGGTSAGVERKPFLTSPTSCSGEPLTARAYVDTYENRGTWNAAGEPQLANPNWQSQSAEIPPITHCDKPAFNPALKVRPTVTESDSPSGYEIDLKVPQNSNPDGVATADLRDSVVNLPEGVSLSPSAADGLQACTDAQLGIGSKTAPTCPRASKIGEVTLSSPSLEDQLTGAIYVGQPTAEDPYRLFLSMSGDGVRVKLAGAAHADPQTGRLTAVFDENPQQPFSELKLLFKSGQRAPLTTPPTCGTFTTTSDLVPWTAPEGADASPQDSFQVNAGPHGTSCFSSLASEPNVPSFEAGTLAPIAGAFSPFALRLHRQDGTQRLSEIDATLPRGLLAKLAGIPYCPDAAIAAAATKSAAEELASPSCPAASEIGSLRTSAGPGTLPFEVDGKAYLAGPYKGAPFSLVTIVPAAGGPYDLGTVVTRTALGVDPETVQSSADSDPLPQVLKGVPIDLRKVALNLDRSQFTVNPTSCEPMTVDAATISALGQPSALSQRFQLGACAALGFKPKLSLKLVGKTHRSAHPALRAVLTMPRSNANMASSAVTLPHTELLDQGHIRTVCTRPEFAEGACPAGSVYGHATAITPLLDQPLSGPVYLRSNPAHKLPDLVADLHGQIHLVLPARIDSVNGGIRTTFESIPDAPVSKFVLSMQGGKKGLLVNDTEICAAKPHATAVFDAHNGRAFESTPALKAGCGKR